MPPTPKDPWPDPPDLPHVCDELLEVRRRRYQEARAAGLSMVEALMFADSDSDIGHLRSMVKGSCAPDVIRNILF